MDGFKLAMCPMVSDIGNTDANAEYIISVSERAKACGCRLVCFPEASLTGYTTSSPPSVREDDPAIRKITQASDGIAICFGFNEDSGEGLFITQAVCENGKTVGRYRKTHLGMREIGVFGPGDSLDVISVEPSRIGISVCWEAHFPEIAGTYRRRGAEVILMPFASPLPHERRIRLWNTVVPARAADNRVYCAACNCDGESVFCASPDGSVLEGEDHGDFVIFDMEPSIFMKYRTPPETMSNIDYVPHRRPELYD